MGGYTNTESAELPDIYATSKHHRNSSACLPPCDDLGAAASYASATSVAHSLCRDDGSHCPYQDPSEQYTVLPRLQGYKLGDRLRKRDRCLCKCKKATSYAMSNLRLGDCAFVIRSNGTFTYAHYEGYKRGDLSSVSFKIDDKGHYKLIPLKEITSFVKIPVLVRHAAVAAGCQSALSPTTAKEASSPSASSTTNYSSGTSYTEDCLTVAAGCQPASPSTFGKETSLPSISSTTNYSSGTSFTAGCQSSSFDQSGSLTYHSSPSIPSTTDQSGSFAGPQLFPGGEGTVEASRHSNAKQKEENHQLHRALSYMSLKLEENEEEY